MRKTGPRRPPPTRPDADQRAIEAIAALEPQEIIQSPGNWPYPTQGVVARGRGRRASSAALSNRAWYQLLGDAGVTRVEVAERGRYLNGLRVPAWVNDLARVSSCYGVQPGSPEHARAVRVVRRAVRTAARAPLFRAALAAECDRLRGGQAPAARLLRWLEERDWSDARPGAAFPEAPPKT